MNRDEMIDKAKDAANFCALKGDPQHAAAIRHVLAALSTPMLEKGSLLPEAVQALALAGRKLDAIRVLRNEHGIGLLLAKDAVEAFIATEQLKREARLLAPPATVAPDAEGLCIYRRCNGVDGVTPHDPWCPTLAAPVTAPPADLVAIVAEFQTACGDVRALNEDGGGPSPEVFSAACDRYDAARDAVLAFPLPEVPDGKA